MVQQERPKNNTEEAAKEYKAEHITVLDGLTPVRKRPAMYIGSTGPDGLHHLIWECLDNCIDEALAGFADEIKVELLPDDYVRVEDNGRGIPVDLHKQTGKSALEVVMTKLHAGAKFDHQVYKVAGGLHGVGVSVVNALSEAFKAQVKRDGFLYQQEYQRGKPLNKVKKIGKTKGTGTIVTFKPDKEIFPETKFSLSRVLEHLRQQAYLTKGVKFIVFDRRKKPEFSYAFYFEGGIVSYVKYLNKNSPVKHPHIFYVSKEIEKVMVEIALQYTDDYKEVIYSFANNIYTPEGGSHLAGFRSALTRTINNYARKKEFLKEKESNFVGEDLREGLTAVISVKVREPQFEGQTKTKLGNPEVKGLVDSVFSESFSSFLEEYPKDAKAIIEKCLLSVRARLAAKQAREAVLKKSTLEGFLLPGKLADCNTTDPTQSELFIVEGDSAGGSCKQARDRERQAVLPLRGKILNVEKARLEKIIANEEVKSLIVALGTNIGDQFQIEKLRYHKIIIATDADIDGSHIKTLLLTLFYRYFPEIILRGHLYIATPPLYRLEIGKELKYAYSEEEKEKIIKNLKEKVVAKNFKIKKIGEAKDEEIPEKISIQRYKGLGEMNPEQLWETTMDPKRRILKKITLEEAEKANEIFEILMGKEVEPRKRFIQIYAKTARHLDI
ncbi:MAG: DNA topoisomerase (ATP-hydrolyzing) subunit B [Patescibacteria group bacterium]|nr:DNA topoisomerase (ATP-hydrolyzing) subunit B [Patescibacteria group bacterium]